MRVEVPKREGPSRSFKRRVQEKATTRKFPHRRNIQSEGQKQNSEGHAGSILTLADQITAGLQGGTPGTLCFCFALPGVSPAELYYLQHVRSCAAQARHMQLWAWNIHGHWTRCGDIQQ